MVFDAFPEPSEELRLKLLEEEMKLRKKQPQHWAKSKYRKYANLRLTEEEKSLFNKGQEGTVLLEKTEGREEKLSGSSDASWKISKPKITSPVAAPTLSDIVNKSKTTVTNKVVVKNKSTVKTKPSKKTKKRLSKPKTKAKKSKTVSRKVNVKSKVKKTKSKNKTTVKRKTSKRTAKRK